MMNARSDRLPALWMCASLALLAGFLALFLKKNYDDGRAALAREVGYLFMSSVREIEGGAIERLVRQRVSTGGLSRELGAEGPVFEEKHPEPPLLLKKKFEWKDSVRIVTFHGGDSGGLHRLSEKNVELRIERRGGPPGDGGGPAQPTDMTGSISMVVALGDGAGDSTAAFFYGKNGFLPKLAAGFDSAMAAAGMRFPHRVAAEASPEASGGDSLFFERQLAAGSYTDLASGERFTAQIAGYQWFVLRRIWASVVFALAVFGCVAAAFWANWRSLREQRRLVEIKNGLLQNISHELKTPVATVGVALEALGSFDAMADEGRTREYLQISKNELSRLGLLVEKVLGMAQFEAGAMPVRRELFDFKKMVEGVLAAMRLQIEKAGAEVSLETTGGPFELSGDELHLSGVVFNLLDNSLKYSGLRPRISMKISREVGGNLLLEVSDSGPGIPEAFREKVFEKFFRLPTGARHDVKGHGLGLAYSAEVVRLHGGRIWAEGSRFFVAI